MSGEGINDGLLTIVQRAEQLRRRRLATRALLRVMPFAAGALLVTAALVRLTHASLSLFWAAAGVAILLLAAVVLIKGRRMAVTDAAATRLDADAALEGELRSAHWFASHPAPPESSAWTDFHLERASRRVDSVSW